MIDGQMLPAIFLHLAERSEQFERIGIVGDARITVHVLQRKKLLGAFIFAADKAARFIGPVAPCLCDKLFDQIVR
jgi:hypothetical protein